MTKKTPDKMPVHIAVVGISHHTAPVELREACSMGAEGARRFVRNVCDEGVFHEVLLVDTCNRTEAYMVSPAKQDAVKYFMRHVAARKGGQLPMDQSAFYCYRQRDAVRHLFRVAAGLDSQIVGEDQILGQVKRAYHLAVEERTTGFMLNRLLHTAFRAGKRVRTETQLNGRAGSVPQAAVELAGSVFSRLDDKTALFIGAGEAPQLAAQALIRRGVRKVIVANRTLAKAQEVARELQANNRPPDNQLKDMPRRCRKAAADTETTRHKSPPEPIECSGHTLDEIPELIAKADVVICAAYCEEPILTVKNVGSVLKRSRSPIFIVDISVPRNVEDAVGDLPEVFLFNIDYLNELVARNIQSRRQEIPLAEAIVADELERFEHWLDRLQLGPTIQALQEHLEVLQQAEIRRYGKKIGEDPEQLELFTRSLCKKILHNPVKFLNDLSKQGQDGEVFGAIDMVRRMFDLDQDQGKR